MLQKLHMLLGPSECIECQLSRFDIALSWTISVPPLGPERVVRVQAGQVVLVDQSTVNELRVALDVDQLIT